MKKKLHIQNIRPNPISILENIYCKKSIACYPYSKINENELLAHNIVNEPESPSSEQLFW